MIDALGIGVRTVTPEDLDEFDGLALVDVQPTVFGEDMPARVRSVDAVIDHHPERPGYDAVFRDIRPAYGATATILTEYIRASGLDRELSPPFRYRREDAPVLDGQKPPLAPRADRSPLPLR